LTTKALFIAIWNLCFKAVGGARDLVKRLLAFSRKQLMEMKTFVLNDLVAQNRLMLERIIGEDISLKIFMDKECGLVKADFHQLEQVLMNLVANARDAMPGGGTIAIETACVELDEEYAAIHAEAAPGRMSWWRSATMDRAWMK
jgi:two-component system cell cycle sensor histidine kinase/response regulator CckA